MNKPELLAFSALLALGCGPADEAPAAGAVSVAALSNDGCLPARTRGLPGGVDTLVVQALDPDAGWQTIATEQREDGFDGQPLLVEGVPSGEAVDLRFVACAGGLPRLLARVDGRTIRQGRKHGLTLLFRPLDQLSCTGTGFGPSYNQFAGLGANRAFPAYAPLPDGRLLIAGGASQVDGDTFTATAAGPAWDVFDPREGLFLPGTERSMPLDPRPMQAARVGAQAFPFRPLGGTSEGVLVVGGAPAVVRGNHPYGPLAPAGGRLSAPAAEFFDPTVPGFAPVDAQLTPRFLAGGAAADGLVVLVGGVEYPGERPSTRVEVIDAGGLRFTDLSTGLVGPTVTPLGGARFLVWGADVDGCGQRPAWLVSITGRIEAVPLTLVADEPAPDCSTPAGACRAWYPTAYHAAARLPDGRVLITGGIAVGPDGLVNNPDQGVDCPPNAVLLDVDAEAQTVELHPVGTGDVQPATLKRAFHRATTVGDRVLVTGGWGSFDNPGAFVVGADAIFYDAARDQFVATAFNLADARLGHVSAPLPDGGVLLAGGLGGRGGAFSAAHTAEVFSPAVSGLSCDPPPAP
ncbi:MAG: hypothetical protein H6704_21555 [Myxococcales bacterium]|nr:hypothetical protein [Myxococcales bacterium]